MNLPARFLNHCCGPNIGVRGDGLNSSDSYDFIALRDIDKGEVRNRRILYVFIVFIVCPLLPDHHVTISIVCRLDTHIF